jgi:hypothetical protein
MTAAAWHTVGLPLALLGLAVLALAVGGREEAGVGAAHSQGAAPTRGRRRHGGAAADGDWPLASQATEECRRK